MKSEKEIREHFEALKWQHDGLTNPVHILMNRAMVNLLSWVLGEQEGTWDVVDNLIEDFRQTKAAESN